jgi:hypothetical protein
MEAVLSWIQVGLQFPQEEVQLNLTQKEIHYQGEQTA